MLKSRKIQVALSSILVIILLVINSYYATKLPVTVVLDGEEKIVRTHANTVAELLKELKVEVLKEDKLTPSLDKLLTKEIQIIWEPAKPVKFIVKGEGKTIWSTAKTVGEFIDEQNYVLSEHDKLSPSKDTELDQNMEIIVDTAFPITLNIANEEKQIWTTSITVADLLKQQEVKLNELDRVEPEATTQVTENMVVTIIRVEKVTDVVEVPIDYAVVTRKDSALTSGQEKIIEKGAKGLEKQYFEVILENGKEVSRQTIKKEKVKDSKDRIVAVGTKPIKPQIARGHDGPVKQEFYVEATAYTAYCPGCTGTTATGINLRKNPDQKVIAVDPSVIPLGTKVHVEGYGYAIAADKGSAIKGNKIDLFMADADQVKRFGRKTVLIKILE